MRLIDADALASLWTPIADRNCLVGNVVSSCLADLDAQPTVDAVPVLHGEWILVAENFSGEVFKCSACKSFRNTNHADFAMGRAKREPPFCEFCGALMDGGTKKI